MGFGDRFGTLLFSMRGRSEGGNTEGGGGSNAAFRSSSSHCRESVSEWFVMEMQCSLAESRHLPHASSLIA